MSGFAEELDVAKSSLKAALAQLAATADVLRIISRSAGDLKPVFDAILEKATALCDADLGMVHLYRDGKQRTVAHRGGSAAFASWLFSRGEFAPPPGSANANAMATGTPMHIADYTQSEVYKTGHPLVEPLVALGGIRTYLNLPMVIDARVVGAIAIYRCEVRPFAEAQIDLLATFAQQAAVAIENARLFNETKEALERQTAAADVLRAISASPTRVQPVLDTIAARAGQLCGGQHSVVVYLLEGDIMRRAASEGALVVGQGGTQPLDRNSVSGHAVIDRRPIHVTDLAAERDSYPRTWAAFEEFLRARGVSPNHSMVSVPLIREGNAIGAIMVRRGEVRPFTANEIELLQTFADQAVIAIENARLFNEIEDKNRQLADWNRTLQARVAEGIATLERAARLQRFLPRQVADMLVGEGGEESLRTHRRDITVVFLDLRGFTAFTETADPEEVMDILGEYYAAMGRLVHEHGGTLAGYSGDGIMAFFNDPMPMPDAPMRAAAMAIEMQRTFGPIGAGWKDRGYDLDLGIGIAQGYATLGTIGFEGRWDYGAIGTVCNLASRLCGEARGGEILASQRVVAALKGQIPAESLGELSLKGFAKPVTAFKLRVT